MWTLIRILICSLCYVGIFKIANIEFVSKEYWIIFILLIIQAVLWQCNK